MTDRTRLQIREAGMSFLPGGGWGQPSYRMRGSEIQEDLERAAPPLWREQPAEFVPTSGQEASCISYWGDVSCRRRAGGIVYLSWPGKALDFPNRSRWKRLGGRVIGAPSSQMMAKFAYLPLKLEGTRPLLSHLGGNRAHSHEQAPFWLQQETDVMGRRRSFLMSV